MFEPPDWEWAQAGDVGWWVRADWRAGLARARRPAARRVAADGRLTTVKTGPHRVVYRVDLPEGAVYVKHFLVPDRRAMLRQWVRRGKGRNEGQRTRASRRDRGADHHADRAGRAAEAEVPVRELPGHPRRFPRRSRSTSSSSSRLPRWPEPSSARPAEARRGPGAVMTARLHDAGFVHQDFHPGNILVRIGDDDQPHLAMIDLDALRVTRPVWQFWEDLARLAKIDFDAQAPEPPTDLGRGAAQPGAAEPLFLASVRPVGSLSLPQSVPAGAAEQPPPNQPPSRAGSRTRRAPGPSGFGGAGGVAAVGATSTSRPTAALGSGRSPPATSTV